MTRAFLTGLLVLSACDPGMEFIDLRVENLTATDADVRFQTSRETTCAIEYGFSADLLDEFAEDPTMGDEDPFSFDHDVPLFDLEPTTTYFWRAAVIDPEGREYFSETLTFETPTGSDDGRPNLSSLGQVDGVSSNWNGGDNSSSFGANNAIDGAMGSEWASDGEGDDAWLEIAWPGSQTLSGVRMRSREMPDGTSIVTSFRLIVGMETLGPFDTPDPSETYTFDFPAFEASSVRFEVMSSTGGNSGLREIQLLGTP